MTKKVEELYEKAMEQITPNVLEEILEQKVVPMKEEDSILAQGERKEKKIGMYVSILGVAVAAMLLFALYNRSVVETCITIDVNPSFEIQLNKKQKVKKVIGINDDAKKIIKKADLEDKNLDNTMEKLMDAMDEDGYFDKNAAVLVSVQNKKIKTAQNIEKKVQKKMNQLCENRTKTPVVYTQSVREDKEVTAVAKDYCISKGRATFICNMVKKNQEWKVEDLASMTVEELVGAVKKKGEKVSEILEKDEIPKVVDRAKENATTKKQEKSKATAAPKKMKNTDLKEKNTDKEKATKKPSQDEKQQEKGKSTDKSNHIEKGDNGQKKNKNKTKENSSNQSVEHGDQDKNDNDTQLEQRSTPLPDKKWKDGHKGKDSEKEDWKEKDSESEGKERSDNRYEKGERR